MRLVHRPGCLKGQNFSRMGNAGYDTIQYGFRPTDDSGVEGVKALWGRLRDSISVFDDSDDVDIYLALLLENDGRLFPNHDYDPEAVQLEAFNVDSWYDDSNDQFYRDLESVIRGIGDNERAGSRLKGIRWNHEFRPTAWKLGSGWTTYATGHAPADFQRVMQHQVQDWHDWRYAIANNDDKTQKWTPEFGQLR